jgi:hypothetical protein
MDSKFQPQALIIDLMGTCCDWNSSILEALKECPPEPLGEHDFPKLAADWRLEFFKEIHRRFQAGLPAEDIDITHRRILSSVWMIVSGTNLLHNGIIRKVIMRYLMKALLNES